ncbi:glycosyl hydrolase family 25 [Bifidobacterium aemilianum]|uniref:Glycosyl hydrolase family 25 n=1 Tax=Bifidobacterium aemilianum TaxID=2493120 RepID=A0A366K9V3_9BIFI|nr:glycoside hydrolase family 25 protein [Bifidobacterium aemilianum]RBP97903.1 glycosyl hydrolase family 25 [Bifidobacterium aemilianum]
MAWKLGKTVSNAVSLVTLISLTVAGLGAVPASATGLSHDSHDGVVEAREPFLNDQSRSTQVTIGDQPASGPDRAMPDNPSQPLPDKVSAAIPDDAVVLSKDLVASPDKKVRNIATGEVVTDPKLVGSPDKPADPLAKTQGGSFIPVQAGQVKRAVEAAGGQVDASGGSDGHLADPSAHRGGSTRSSRGSVRQASLQNNDYGAYWGSYNGTQAFFEASGQLFVQQAKGVVDVSQWQGNIDWQTAMRSGVEGAIIRIGYGWDNGLDYQAQRNINECKRLGIPFGVYLYSYAYDAGTGAAEGAGLVNLLRRAGVNPGDLSYPVYYDLERWEWAGHAPPTSPAVYDGIVNSWWGQLQAAGYNNLSIYSYTSYLNTALNSATIRSRTRWVASYGARTGFGFSPNDRGWQYADNGRINGINGNVDLNAFGNRDAVAADGVTLYRVYNPNSGEHFLTPNEYEYRLLAQAGWRAEGVAWVAPFAGAPVYRLYSLNQGWHLFTVNSNEYNMLTRYRWRQEGISWQSGGPVLIYRMYNPNSGQHLFTVNSYEKDYLSRMGWRYEGVAWSAMRA